MPDAVGRDLEAIKRFAHIGLDHGPHLLGVPGPIEMLGRNDDLGHPGRLAVLVFDGDLRFRVRTELSGFAHAVLAGVGHELEDLLGIVDRRRHQIGRLVAGITEHDALIARAFLTLLVRSIVDALGNVDRLRVQQHVDLGGLPVKAGLLVADGLDGAAGGGLELARIDDRLAMAVGLQKRVGHADLAGDDDAVGRGQGLAGDAHVPRVGAGLFGFLIDEVDDLVGDAVADFVGMSFGHGFRGELIGSSRHVFPQCFRFSAICPRFWRTGAMFCQPVRLRSSGI